MDARIRRTISNVTERTNADGFTFPHGPLQKFGSTIHAAVGQNGTNFNPTTRRLRRIAAPVVWHQRIDQQHGFVVRNVVFDNRLPDVQRLYRGEVGGLTFSKAKPLEPTVSLGDNTMLKCFKVYEFWVDVNTNIDLQYSAQDYYEWMYTNKNPHSMSNHSKALMRLAYTVYKNCIINMPKQMALVYVEFAGERGGYRDFHVESGKGARSTHTIYARLKLSSSNRVVSTETFYIASHLARVFKTFTDVYDIDETNPWKITGFRIRGILSGKYETYSSVIHGSKADVMQHMAKNCADPVLRNEIVRMYKMIDVMGYKLISPGTYKNCFVRAIVMASGVNLNRKSSAERGSRDMRAAFPDGVPRRLKLNTLCRALRKNNVFPHHIIEIVNYKLKVIKRIVPRSSNPLELDVARVMVAFGHTFALSKSAPTIITLPRSGARKYKRMYLRPEDKMYSAFFAFDLETFKAESGLETPYAAGCQLPEDIYFSYTDIGCEEKMIDEAMHRLASRDTAYLKGYGFNAGTFDTPPIARALFKYPEKYEVIKIFDHNNRMLSLKVISKIHRCSNDKYVTLELRDMYPLAPGKLSDVAKSFGTAHRKDLFDHTKVTHENYMEEYVRQNGAEYLKNDVLTLAEIVDAYQQEGMSMYGFDPLRSLTLSGIARKLFLVYYYDDKRFPLYELSPEMEAFCREGYCAGWSFAERIGLFTQVHLMKWADKAGIPRHKMKYRFRDIISDYPNELTKPLPYGYPEWVNVEGMEGYITTKGVVECLVRGGSMRKRNWIRVKTEWGVTAPYFSAHVAVKMSTRLYNTIYSLGGCGYKIQPIRLLRFKFAPYMRKMIDTVYRWKAEAPKPSVRRDMAKLTINSFYGFPAIALRSRKLILNRSKNELIKAVVSGDLVQYSKNISVIESDVDATIRYVPISLWTADGAYIRLKTAAFRIEGMGGVVMFGDTDSIGYAGTDDMLPLGSELGDWSNEEPPADEIAVAGVKMYAFGENHVRCKGFPNKMYLYRKYDELENVVSFEVPHINGTYAISMEDIVLLTRGARIKVSYPSFECGKRGWTSSEVTLRRHEATRTIRSVMNKLREDPDNPGCYIPKWYDGEVLYVPESVYDSLFFTTIIIYVHGTDVQKHN